MDSSDNAARSASTSSEPLSGKLGDTSKGQPYDAGNMPDDEQQKLTRDADETGGDHGNEAVGSSGKTDNENAAEEEVKNPEGPGPKPVSALAAEHGGDAGAKGPVNDGSEEGEKASGGDAGGDGKGTGEEYVKTTGLAADGGDFDATKPGAGREADRLMEEKGMHREEGSKSKESKDTSHASASKDDDSGKPSLGDRIKAKFHKS